MVQGQYQIEIRRTLYEQDARWKQKLVLRAISMFFSLLGVIIFGIVLFKTLALTTTSAGGQNPDIVLEGPHVQDGLPLAPVSLQSAPSWLRLQFFGPAKRLIVSRNSWE